MAFAETQELVVKLSLKGDLSSKLRGAIRDVNAFDKATSRTQKSLGKFGSNIGRAATVGLAATAGGFLAVVDAAKDYESAFAGVRKTVSATEPELQKLSDQFRALSKEIPISAAELARLGEAGGALGVPTAQLEEFVRVTALLGVTTNLTADEAANSLGVLSNVLHLTGAEYSQFASALVALGNAGASTESQIIAIAERAGAAGELIGVSTEQVLGFSSAIASLGIESEAGGTALQKLFIDTAKISAKGGKELKLLAKTAGKTGKAFQKAFEEDAGEALQDFLEGLGKLPQAQQLAILEDLGFEDSRITRTLLGLANNTKLVSDQMNVANKAFKENTALTKEAEQRFNTFDSALQITKNTLTDMGITIGSKLLPKLVPLLKRLNEFVTSHQADIEKFGDDLAEGFGKFADELGKIDWRPFIDGLKLTRDVVKVVIDAFQALPAEVRNLVIAGAAINKVTGGLITSVTKDIAGLGIKLFLEKGQTPANPLWVAMAGGGGGVVGTAGGAGKVGAVAGALTKVFIAGAAVGIFSELLGDRNAQAAANKVLVDGLDKQTAKFTGGASLAELKTSLAGVDAQMAKLNADLTPEAIAYQLDIDGVKTGIEQSRADIVAAIAREEAKNADKLNAAQAARDSALLGATKTLDATTRSQLSGVISQVNSMKSSTLTATDAVKNAVKSGTASTTSAINRKKWRFQVDNYITTKVSVSLRETIKSETTSKKIGNVYAQ